MNRSLRNTLPAAILAASICFLVTGCGQSVGSSFDHTPPEPVSSATPALAGTVYGGQQPISGATIQLYGATGTSYGAASSSLLGGQVVTTNSNGAWSIASFTCPSPATETYLTATGGVSTVGGSGNPNVVNIVALGPCGTLTSTYQHINDNELTTVAAVYALSGFMTGPTNVGAPTSNAIGLTNAFASATVLVNSSTGNVPGTALPANATEPTSELNTLADILASCVNTDGSHTAGDGSTCGTLFNYARNGSGTAPTTTAAAALNIAQNPGQNIAHLTPLANSTSPFQPVLTANPNDFTVAVRYAPSLTSPVGIAADQSGNIWIADKASKVVELNPTGTVLSGAGYASGKTGNGAIAIDLTGNAWVAGSTSGQLLKIAPGGTVSTITGGGLTTTNSIAIDGTGQVWASGTGNVLSGFSSSGTALSSTGFTGGGTSNGQSVAVTSH